MTRRINAAGRALIEEFEQGPGGGPALLAYRCPAGIPTLGWGHTKGVKMGDRCSWIQAELMLEEDLQWAENEVASQVLVPLGDNEFAALASFTFNAGRYAFDHSTLLVDVNLRDPGDVPAQLAQWIHVKGAVVPGLVRRRDAEIALWRAPDAAPPSPLAEAGAAPLRRDPDNSAPSTPAPGSAAAPAPSGDQP